MSYYHIVSIYKKLNNLLLSTVGYILYIKVERYAEKQGEHPKNN